MDDLPTCEICGNDLISRYSTVKQITLPFICRTHRATTQGVKRCKVEAVYWPDDEHVTYRCVLPRNHKGVCRFGWRGEEAD